MGASWTVNGARLETTLFASVFEGPVQIITHFLSLDVNPNDGIKAILGNSVKLNAYRKGLPEGKPFPEGSMIVKIQWSKKKNPVSSVH